MDGTTMILVVDDDESVRDCLVWTLTPEGYQVITASDGMEAISMLESERVDLILADISMPRMNGYQLHTKVTENPAWVAIPFVFLTARSLDSDVRYGKELGCG